MKLSLILIFIITTLGIYFYGYPAYQLSQEEQRIRNSMRNIPNNAIATNLQNIAGFSAKAEMLNQYPKFLVYIMLDDYEKTQLDPDVAIFVRNFSCYGLNRLTQYPELERKATLNIMKEDQHQFEYTVKNIFGDVLFQHTQRMSECPNFANIESYTTPKNNE